MSYVKNQKIELDIIDITKDGLGLAKNDSQVFFVKDAIVGDKVSAIITKVTSNVVYAKALEVLEKSKYRVDTKCKVANSCGGCQLLNLDYKKQIELKAQNVINSISKIGKFDIDYINKCYDGIISMDMPHRFRNKMQVPFALRDGKVIYGFYAGRTHHIIEFDYCLAGFKGSDIILNAIKEAIEKFNISVYNETTAQGVFREVMFRRGNTSGELSITYIINDKDYTKNLELYKTFDKYIVENIREKLKSPSSGGEYFKPVTSTININTNNNNVLFGNKNIALSGKGYIEDSIGDIKYHISPESFYQVNIQMTNKLYDKVVEFANFKGTEKALDLYCGIGTISLYIANRVKKVLGIEIVERAIEDAKTNAKLNNITNVNFVCRDISRLTVESMAKDYDIKSYDTLIVDPPRKGLDGKAIEFIKEIEPTKIIYVSCDPATLARDLDEICHSDCGYSIEKIVNVDMFPYTMHVETIASIVHI